MAKVLRTFERGDEPSTNGTSLKGYLNLTYDQLVDRLGEPTINEPSGDNKTQVEWVVAYGDDIFTIYDWKTFDKEYTIYALGRFNVGGNSYAGDFISYLESL